MLVMSFQKILYGFALGITLEKWMPVPSMVVWTIIITLGFTMLLEVD